MNKLLRTLDGMLMFYCPGCKCSHGVYPQQVEPKPMTGARWQWNGSMNVPTFSPSILVRGTVPLTDDQINRVMNDEHIDPIDFTCHSFVREGRIEYLSDCTHELAGQTVEMQVEE